MNENLLYHLQLVLNVFDLKKCVYFSGYITKGVDVVFAAFAVAWVLMPALEVCVRLCLNLGLPV